MEVLVEPPEELHLEGLRAVGPQPNENLQEESDDEEEGPKADPGLVSELMAMGFGENGCKRAAIAVKNGSLEAAMEWVLTHMEDANFNAPIESENLFRMRYLLTFSVQRRKRTSSRKRRR